MRELPAVTLVKLGGSLLTEKRAREAARTEVIRDLARQVGAAARRAPGTLVVGHGSGSFGHAEARARGLSAAPARLPPAAVDAVRMAAARLHDIVLAALREAGARPTSFPPSAHLVATRRDCGEWPRGGIDDALLRGELPVVYGDVVLDADGAARVCSTEDVLLAVAASLRAAGRRILRAVWLGETDGVLDAAGVRIPELVALRDGVPESAGPAAGADVTGGMAHRVSRTLRLAEQGVPSWIGDGRARDALERVLGGREEGGTWVRPATAPPDG